MSFLLNISINHEKNNLPQLEKISTFGKSHSFNNPLSISTDDLVITAFVIGQYIVYPAHNKCASLLKRFIFLHSFIHWQAKYELKFEHTTHSQRVFAHLRFAYVIFSFETYHNSTLMFLHLHFKFIASRELSYWRYQSFYVLNRYKT